MWWVNLTRCFSTWPERGAHDPQDQPVPRSNSASQGPLTQSLVLSPPTTARLLWFEPPDPLSPPRPWAHCGLGLVSRPPHTHTPVVWAR